MRRNLILYAAAGFVAVGFLATSPAQASFGVIKWSGTNICQIWDYGLPTRPFPSNYSVMTRPLPSFGAALSAKDRLLNQRRCLI